MDKQCYPGYADNVDELKQRIEQTQRAIIKESRKCTTESEYVKECALANIVALAFQEEQFTVMLDSLTTRRDLEYMSEQLAIKQKSIVQDVKPITPKKGKKQKGLG